MNERYLPYANLSINIYQYPSVIQEIIKNILKLFNKTAKNEKYAVLSIVADIITKKDLRKNGFTFSNTMYNTAKRKRNENEIEDRVYRQPESKKRKGEDINDLIKEKLSQYSELTCKIHRNQPIMNLQQSKSYIYKKLIEENPEIKLGRSTFYKLCPKNFQYSKKKTDMCDICENGKKLEKRLGENSEDRRIKFFKDHKELNQDQKTYYRQKIQNLEDDECIVVMDFKQNFKIGGGPVEMSQSFYNKSSISCLGFCVIYKLSGEVQRTYYDYLSEVISHDSYFVINCLKKLEAENLERFSKIHFWSDNAGHFRSEELRNYILLEIPTRNFTTSQNFFVEYHGKSDIDGHFGLLQRVFNEHERKNDTVSIYCLLFCFWDYFLDAPTNVVIDIYEDPGRSTEVQRLKIKRHKQYMSFLSDSGTIYGKSVSTLEESNYRKLSHKVVTSVEMRKNRYAPKLKPNSWAISSSQLKIMEQRVALKA